jgi:hypothetical protein
MKRVRGNVYIARSALAHAPEPFRAAIRRTEQRIGVLSMPWNVVRVSGNDLDDVSLLLYPYLDTHPHPWLGAAMRVRRGAFSTSGRVGDNPLILHRIEALLDPKDPRVPGLSSLTRREEAAGLYASSELVRIGRRLYWNRRCDEVGLVESKSPPVDVATRHACEAMLATARARQL